ncbi:MAG: hypothetical protein HY901_02740 [Deltaproteobacteria bacterium]|nr:hypothetical protein [Deltaproteobacteria bacterium]
MASAFLALLPLCLGATEGLAHAACGTALCSAAQDSWGCVLTAGQPCTGGGGVCGFCQWDGTCCTGYTHVDNSGDCNFPTCYPTCNDANACTTETCDSQTRAMNVSLLPDGTPCSGGICITSSSSNGTSASCYAGCLISGSLRTPGQLDPANSCRACVPSISTSAYSNQDGLGSCASGKVCRNGSCTDGCFIGGTFVAPQTIDPTNKCQRCEPTLSRSSWTTFVQCLGPVPDQCRTATGASCVAATGLCSYPIAPGKACDDGNVCTSNESCNTSGACTGGSSVSGSCNDNNACTSNDRCSGGACVGDAKVCNTPPNSLCYRATGTCSAGSCSYTRLADDTVCNDDDLCTLGERCHSGMCTAATTVSCSALDQCHNAGRCSALTGVCSDPPKDDGTACDDHKACTSGDACQGGICTPSIDSCGCVTSADCPAADLCHLAPTCDLVTGTCNYPNKPDDTPCDDGSRCTSDETCQSGICTPAATVTCAALDSCHDVGTCDDSSGVCSQPLKTDGTPCDDFKACTFGDVCQAGLCTPSVNECGCRTSADCLPAGLCQNAPTCDAVTGTCNHTSKANGTPCDDGSKCTSGETCQAGACIAETTVSCTALDQCHDAASCDPGTGRCPNPAKPDGTPCDDHKACTTGDSCQEGACLPASDACACRSALDCSVANSCQASVACDVVTGSCSYQPKENGIPCDDHNLCTSGDHCLNGTCSFGTSVTCGAPGLCHDTVACDPRTGLCPDPPASADGTVCDDGNDCTQDERCGSGVCTGTAAADGTACAHGMCQGGVCTSQSASGTPDLPVSHYGCGCAASGGGWPAALALVAAMAALGLRRRRRNGAAILFVALWLLSPSVSSAQQAEPVAAGAPPAADSKKAATKRKPGGKKAATSNPDAAAKKGAAGKAGRGAAPTGATAAPADPGPSSVPPAPLPEPVPAISSSAVVEAVPSSPSAKRLRLAFLGVAADANAKGIGDSVSEYVQSQLHSLGAYEVIGKAEIRALLGFEKEKQLLGCAEESCLAEVGGAMAAERVISGTLAQVGDSYLLNLSLIDSKRARLISRVGRRVVGTGSLDPLLDLVRPALVELVEADPKHGAISRKGSIEARGFGGFCFGLRGEADVLGGVTGGLVLEYSAARLGGAASVLWAHPAPAARLELRLYPLVFSRVRLYVSPGATLIYPALAVRGAVGAQLGLGHFQIFADAGYERFLLNPVVGAKSYKPDAVLVAVGAGWLL